MKKIVIALGLFLSFCSFGFSAMLEFHYYSNVPKGCPIPVEIWVHATAGVTEKVDVKVLFNDKFIINGFKPAEGTFANYSTPEVQKAQNWEYMNKDVLAISAETLPGEWFEGKVKFWTLMVTILDDIEKETVLKFYAIEEYNDDDSNIRSKNSNWEVRDTLDTWIHVLMTSKEGTCEWKISSEYMKVESKVLPIRKIIDRIIVEWGAGMQDKMISFLENAHKQQPENNVLTLAYTETKELYESIPTNCNVVDIKNDTTGYQFRLLCRDE